MRQVLEPVEVRLEGELPRAFRWRRKVYPVEQVLESWIYRGKWWTDDRLAGERRVYYRLQARRGTYELYRSDQRGWVLSRVFD